jgi:hypothetical protein
VRTCRRARSASSQDRLLGCSDFLFVFGLFLVLELGDPPLPGIGLIEPLPVDRRLAYKNLRTGLIAGAIALVVFGLAWVVGFVY